MGLSSERPDEVPCFIVRPETSGSGLSVLLFDAADPQSIAGVRVELQRKRGVPAGRPSVDLYRNTTREIVGALDAAIEHPDQATEFCQYANGVSMKGPNLGADLDTYQRKQFQSRVQSKLTTAIKRSAPTDRRRLAMALQGEPLKHVVQTALQDAAEMIPRSKPEGHAVHNKLEVAMIAWSCLNEVDPRGASLQAGGSALPPSLHETVGPLYAHLRTMPVNPATLGELFPPVREAIVGTLTRETVPAVPGWDSKPEIQDLDSEVLPPAAPAASADAELADVVASLRADLDRLQERLDADQGTSGQLERRRDGRTKALTRNASHSAPTISLLNGRRS